MKLKELLKLFDNWNIKLRINDEECLEIVEYEHIHEFAFHDEYKDTTFEYLFEYEVISFGVYENTLCVRVKIKTKQKPKQKVSVFIEQHLCREIVIEAPIELNTDEAMEYAEEKVKNMYDNEEIILTADDYNGVRLWMTEHENGTCTDWRDM